MSEQARRWAAAAALAAALSLFHDSPAWRYAAAGNLDALSLGLLWSHAAYPALLALLGLAACAAVGRVVLEALGLDSGADRAVAAAAGLALAGLAALLLGLAGRYDKAGFGLLLLAAAAAALRLAWARPAPERRAPLQAPRLESGLDALLAGFCLYACWHAFALACAPVTHWDSLAYHLALPRIYAARGAVVELPWLLHSHWPHATELLYGAALALGRDGAAALFHAGLCAAWIAAAALAARRWAGAHGWTVAAVLAAQPAVLAAAGTPHGDGAWALLHLACAIALFRWREEDRDGWLWAAGLCAGGAAAAKLLGALALPVFAAWAWSRGGAAAAARFCLAALAVCGPWYAKAWVTAGNPVWPFLPGVFAGAFGGPDIAGPLARANTWTGWPGAAAALRYGTQWLLLPAAAAAALAFRRREAWPPWLVLLWLPSIVMVPALWRHHEGWRFMMPLYPAMAATLAWQLRKRLEERGPARAVLLLLLGLSLTPLARVAQSNQLFAVLGLRSRRAPLVERRRLYLDMTLFGGAGLREAGPAVGSGRVLLFREIRGYAVDADYLWGDPVIQKVVDYAALPDGAALRARLAELGVTHVLVNEGIAMYAPGAGVYSPSVDALMKEALAKAAVVRRDGPVVLYKLL